MLTLLQARPRPPLVSWQHGCGRCCIGNVRSTHTLRPITKAAHPHGGRSGARRTGGRGNGTAITARGDSRDTGATRSVTGGERRRTCPAHRCHNPPTRTGSHQCRQGGAWWQGMGCHMCVCVRAHTRIHVRTHTPNTIATRPPIPLSRSRARALSRARPRGTDTIARVCARANARDKGGAHSVRVCARTHVLPHGNISLRTSAHQRARARSQSRGAHGDVWCCGGGVGGDARGGAAHTLAGA